MQKKNQKKQAEINVRLSKNVVPREYDIRLKPDLNNFTFEGIETITLSLSKSTKILTLHSKDIEIETAHISVNKEKLFAEISYNEENETATFVFPKKIVAREAKLVIIFRGILNDKMRGFYRSRYHIGGVERHMATTQFEATDARRAFPCFDEPAQKAVFNVSLVVPNGKTAISNTLPVSVLEHEAGFQIIKFAPTPIMSTYLLAFIVGDFEYIEKKSNRGVIVRVHTTPGKKHQAEFALEVTVRTLEFYEEYFKIPYPLNTLDMIAIPDFTARAMENWGAITYRESVLLVDEDHTSLINKQWAALVIAHELAHQWFGNLVTMEWWTHLWLNEGFASYVEYMAVDKLFPKWDIWTQFSVNDLGTGLKLDALKNTHPIEIPVHHPNEIGEIFDAVSYCKGASVIRMLSEYLGEKNFRDGLRYYLKKHSYKNTETNHLWEAFEKISKKPVSKIMENWTKTPGYPVVTAEVKNGKLSLSQSRFFSSSVSKAKSKDKTIWRIPISIGSNVKKNSYLLSGKNLTLPLSPRSVTKVNIGESGFFRTSYSKELLHSLAEPVKNQTISARDRLGIIRDLFALAEAGNISATNALEFLSSYKNETDYTVWVEIASGLSRIEQAFAKNKTIQKGIEKITLDLFSPVFKRLGWNKKDTELHTDTLLRSIAISRLGKYGNQEIIQTIKAKFEKLEKKENVDPDMREVIYNTIARNGGEKEYQTLIKKYQTEALQEEKNRIGESLGNFKDPKIIKLMCEFTISKDVRMQDTVSMLATAGLNPFARDQWWKFIKKNWKLLSSRHGEDLHTLGRLISPMSQSSNKQHLQSFKKFFNKRNTLTAKRTVEQVIERIESNIAWLKRDEKKIEKFLN